MCVLIFALASYINHQISLSFWGLNYGKICYSRAQTMLSILTADKVWLKACGLVSVCCRVGVTGGVVGGRWSVIIHSECSATFWIEVRVFQKSGANPLTHKGLSCHVNATHCNKEMYSCLLGRLSPLLQGQRCRHKLFVKIAVIGEKS